MRHMKGNTVKEKSLYLFSKLAALTPEEAEALQAAVRRHAAFEATAAKGNMSSDDTAQMRHNIERLKAYRQKKKDDSFKIPDWVRNPSGSPPSPTPRSGASGQRGKGREQAGNSWGPGSRNGPSSGSRPNSEGSPPNWGPRPGPSPYNEQYNEAKQKHKEWEQEYNRRQEDYNRAWEEQQQRRRKDREEYARGQERGQERARAHEEYHQRRSEAEGTGIPSSSSSSGFNASGAGHALAALGGLGYMAFAPQKKDPNEAPSELKGRLGAHMQTTVPLGIAGHLIGDFIGGKYAPSIGALGGAALGALGGETLYRVSAPYRAEHKAESASASPGTARALRRDAKRTGASLGRSELLTSGLVHFSQVPLMMGAKDLPRVAASATSHALGKGLFNEYVNARAMQSFNKNEEKSGVKSASLEFDRLSAVDFFSKLAETNAGKWWEEVGGPHLAKGGNKRSFEKLMTQAGLSDAHKKRFRTAYGRIEDQKKSTESTSSSTGPNNYTTNSYGEQVPNKFPSLSPGRVQQGLYGAGTVAGLGYLAAAPKTKDPDSAPQEWKGRLGEHMQMTLPGAIMGDVAGRMGRALAVGQYKGKGRGLPSRFAWVQHAPALGALAGTALGALGAEAMHYANKKMAPISGEEAFESEEERKKLIQAASQSAAKNSQRALLMRGAGGVAPAFLAKKNIRHLAGTLPGMALSTVSGSIGAGLAREYGDSLAMQRMRELEASPPELTPEQRSDQISLHGRDSRLFTPEQRGAIGAAEDEWDTAHRPNRIGAMIGAGLGGLAGVGLARNSGNLLLGALAGVGTGAIGGRLLGGKLFGDKKRQLKATKEVDRLTHEYSKSAFATNAFSGPMNPNIQSGASIIPPFKQPSLRTPVEKVGEIKEAFGPADAKSVLQAVKPRVLKAPSTASMLGAGSPTPGAAYGYSQPARQLGEDSRHLQGFGVPKEMISAAQAPMLEESKQLGGRVLVPRGGDVTRNIGGMYSRMASLNQQTLKAAPSLEPILGPRVKKTQEAANAFSAVREPNDRMMLDAAIKGHELNEATVPPRRGFAELGHRSPEVILREHNLAATLPEGSPVKGALKAMREHHGEAAALRGVGLEYGEGRISRHARKHFTNMLAAPQEQQMRDMFSKTAAGLGSRMLVGSGLGALAGAGYHAIAERTPSGLPPIGGRAQALDNNSPDPFFGNGKEKFHDASQWHIKNAPKDWKSGTSYRRGSAVLLEVPTEQKDVVGRTAPVLVWGDAQKEDVLGKMKEFSEGIGRTYSPEELARAEALVNEAKKSWWRRKTAAGAPTRGNFMMASDVPPFKVPSLRAPIEKNSDMLDTYYPYGPGDFKPARLTGRPKTAAREPRKDGYEHYYGDVVGDIYRNPKLAPIGAVLGGLGGASLAQLGGSSLRNTALAAAIGAGVTGGVGYLARKVYEKHNVDGSERRKIAGLSPMQSATHAKTIGAPKISAPPGPSIADIAKPRGPGMGVGIAGAFKGSIGGTAGVSQK